MSAQNDVRLLDAITIKHGPIDLLSRFFLAADQHVRDRGITLRLRDDMDALVELNKREVENGNWYPLLGAFDTRYQDVTSENAFWIAGYNRAGEIISAHSGRIYDWPDSSLADHASELLFPDPTTAEPMIVDCPTAHLVRGRVFFGGAAWIRPDCRRLGVATTTARIARAYGVATWGVEWMTAYLQRKLIDFNYHIALGYPEATFSLKAFGTPWGDLDIALARQSALHLIAQIELFVASGAKSADSGGDLKAA